MNSNTKTHSSRLKRARPDLDFLPQATFNIITNARITQSFIFELEIKFELKLELQNLVNKSESNALCTLATLHALEHSFNSAKRYDSAEGHLFVKTVLQLRIRLKK